MEDSELALQPFGDSGSRYRSTDLVESRIATPLCKDGSDETTEVCGANCEKIWDAWGKIWSGGFACSNGQCIPPHWKCDGGRHGDCDDGSDETDSGCSQVTFLAPKWGIIFDKTDILGK